MLIFVAEAGKSHHIQQSVILSITFSVTVALRTGAGHSVHQRVGGSPNSFQRSRSGLTQYSLFNIVLNTIAVRCNVFAFFAAALALLLFFFG